MSESLLSMTGIIKTFPGMIALDHVDFNLRAGEIHALMGENGAGKSTLIKVMTGVHIADSGSIKLDGTEIHPHSPSEANRLGISTVYQEVNLAPNLSVAENVCLGREPRGLTGIKWREVRQRADAALQKLGITLDAGRSLGSYSVAIQQMVAIARALDVQAKVLVLDEPTSSLDKAEVAQLFDAMRRLRDQGLGIVFVSHFLDQIYEISDRMTILRNGKLVTTGTVEEINRQALVKHMIGRDMEATTGAERAESSEVGENVLAAKGLGRKGSVSGVELTVGEGEVVGLAGLLGSGRTESVRLFFGIDSPDAGSIEVGGKPTGRWNSRKAIANGMALCPEDRKVSGIIPELSVRENIVLVLQSRRGWLRPLSPKKQRELADEMVAKLHIATSDIEKPIQFLSGGNQQKALLARWLVTEPKLMLLDEPTRGIDIGAKLEIMNLVEELRKRKMSFVFVSSELAEVVRACRKVAVLRDREMVDTLIGDQITEERIMETIAGGSH